MTAEATTQDPAPAGINANVDQAELAKFGALAARWWDPNSEFKPLHQINPLRLNHIDERVGIKGKRIVDIGCGGGILAESMAVRGADVTGIDLSEKPLNVAKLHLLESGQKVDYRLVSAEDLAKQNPAEFDCVTCMEMLEHVPVPTSTIQACADLVKPGGWVFFSTLNRNPKSFLFAIIGAEYVLKLLPKGTHEYRRFITPAELAEMARKAGLNVSGLTGMSYNPFTRNYALNDDVTVNYIVACRKPL
jgi:2-polyprenyl-6-hydroxyphenyl methylase/3-demethylubiquinone-9 3-methyltransferase